MLLAAGEPAAEGFRRALRASWLARYADAEFALTDDRSEAASWLRAWIACARGSFAEALRRAEPLGLRTPSRSLRVAASVTAGSALRQLGRYGDAARSDRRALGDASAPAERGNAMLGLAADAVGAGDVEQARAWLYRAQRVGAADPRSRIRQGWVRAEVALMTGDARAAEGGARTALSHATASGARRHTAKSALFLGVALRAQGNRDAERWLDRAERLATAIGARAVAGVARDLLKQGAG